MTAAVNTVHVSREQPTSTFITTERVLPEMTLKAILLGFVLAIVLCASNVYVALKVGRTISGSIPAAVLSMLFLRFWKNTTILEHNIVQTTASAGEVVSAGITFTIPALVLMGFWDHFHYFEMLSVALIGGFLGVAFSVPLRRSMIVQQKLPFPEGIATAEVLKSGDRCASGNILVSGGLFAALFTSLQEGIKWLSAEIHAWKFFGKTPLGFGLELSPVLVGAGYIVGLRVSATMILGSVITWAVGLPLYCALYGAPDLADPHVVATTIWKSKLRFMGIGAMIVGGLWGMISLAKTIYEAVASSLDALKNGGDAASVARTERDIPINYVMIMTLLLAVPIFFLFYTSLSIPLALGTLHGLIVALCAALISLFIAFGCAAIGSFLSGIVGSTLMPVSGITISGILMFGTVIFLLLAGQIDFSVNKDHALSIAAATILFASLIALSSSVSGDNMQDLKSGALVGATPWKQQVMLLVGVVGGAIVVGPVLQLLFTAYGIGDVMPRPGMDPTQTLNAPQAMMMATMAKGLFAGGIEWNMIYIGAGIGCIIVLVDYYLKSIGKANYLPILAVAFGMYMPISYILTFCVGGLISHYAHKKRQDLKKEERTLSEQNGILYASGVIAGTALMGVIVSIPMAQGIDLSTFVPSIPTPLVTVGGIGFFAALLFLMYQKGTTSEN